jgi:hypothetical protein
MILLLNVTQSRTLYDKELKHTNRYPMDDTILSNALLVIQIRTHVFWEAPQYCMLE